MLYLIDSNLFFFKLLPVTIIPRSNLLSVNENDEVDKISKFPHKL